MHDDLETKPNIAPQKKVQPRVHVGVKNRRIRHRSCVFAHEEMNFKARKRESMTTLASPPLGDLGPPLLPFGCPLTVRLQKVLEFCVRCSRGFLPEVPCKQGSCSLGPLCRVVPAATHLVTIQFSRICRDCVSITSDLSDVTLYL